MAKRDILKEAIADAKTVKETAIANAKAALEEAFTPRLKEMLATKLEEMDLDEEEEALKEKKKYSDDNRKPAKDEYKPEKDTVDRKMMEGEDLDEEIDLDEILAEIELDEEDKDEIKEDEATRKEEEGYIDGEEDADKDMEDKEDEEIDLEDMTDEDLKDFIEDVIADMVASGDLEAGENFEEEGEEEEVDVDVEDDVDVEISEANKKDKEDDKDKMEEAVGNPISTSVKAGSKNKYDEDFMKAVKDDLQKLMSKVGLKEEDEIDEAASGTPTSTSYSKGNKYDEDFMKAVKDDLAKLMSKVGLKEEELDEAYNTIESLKSDLNEVNLLNAKLLYTNKIFKAKTLTESQKVKVLGAFDKAGTVKETKLVFETLNEGLKTKKTSMIKESLGSASRVSTNVNAKKPIIETDPMVERFKKLAGLK
jgi:hypothetical protein